MTKYILTQKKVLKESFRINNFFRIFCLETLKYVIILILIFSFSLLLSKTLTSIMPLLNTAANIQSTDFESIDENLLQEFESNYNLFDTFIIKIIISSFLFLLFVSVAISLFDSIAFSYLKDESYSIKIFYRLMAINSILIFSYTIISIFIIHNLSNIYAIAVLLLLLLLIALYYGEIFYISLNRKDMLKKAIIIGLKNSIKIKQTILPCITIFFIGYLAATTLIFLGLLVRIFLLILILLFILLILHNIWSKNYFYKLFQTKGF